VGEFNLQNKDEFKGFNELWRGKIKKGLEIFSEHPFTQKEGGFRNYIFGYSEEDNKLYVYRALPGLNGLKVNSFDWGDGWTDFVVQPSEALYILAYKDTDGTISITQFDNVSWKWELDSDNYETKKHPANTLPTTTKLAIFRDFLEVNLVAYGEGTFVLFKLSSSINDTPQYKWKDTNNETWHQILKMRTQSADLVDEGVWMYNKDTGKLAIYTTTDFGSRLDKRYEGNIGSEWTVLSPISFPAAGEYKTYDPAASLFNLICIPGTEKTGDKCIITELLQEPFFQCFKGDLTLVGEKVLCVTDLVDKLFSTTDFSPPISYSAFTTDFSPPISYVEATTDFSPPISYVEATTDFSPPISYVVSTPCPEGFDYNIVEGNCETTPKSDCSKYAGTKYNSLTGNCEIFPARSCPAGTTDKGVNCTGDPTRTCPSGSRFNSVTGFCERDTTKGESCTGGECTGGDCVTEFGIEVCTPRICVPKICVPTESCPSGFVAAFGKCRATAKIQCPSGTKEFAGFCTADVMFSCPSGTSMKGLVCAATPAKSCPPPSVLTQPLVGNPICVTDSNLVCPLGFAPLVEDFGQFDFAKCFSLPKLECPPGLELIGDICKGTPTDCPTGFTKNAFGDCESPLFCNIGLVPDPKTGLCMWPPIDEPKLPDDEPELGNGLKIPDVVIPSWVKDIAAFWCADEIGSGDFVQVIQWMIKEGLIMVPQDSVTTQTSTSSGVPDWIQFNACIWHQGEIGDKEFSTTLQWLIDNGIIKI